MGLCARTFVGSLLFFLLCSVEPPLARAQYTCATKPITSSIACTTNCGTATTSAVVTSTVVTGGRPSIAITGSKQDPSIATAPACCGACALADPFVCAVWSFVYASLDSPQGPTNPETAAGTCYFLTDANCASATGSIGMATGQAGGRPCPIVVTQDPHCNVGGVTFDFHGTTGLWYAFLTDFGLQINAKLVGPAAECPEKKTWLEQIAVLWIDESGKKRSLAVRIDQEANWYEEDVLNFESDGQRVEAPVRATNDPSDSEPEVAWMAADGSASVLRVPNQWNASVLSIPDVIMVDISSAVDEWIQGSADPLGAYGKYLDMSITYLRPPSPSVHGIIGQMLQPNAYEIKMAIETRDGENRERVEGSDDMYQVAGLTDTMCHFCRFDQGTI